MIKAILFDYGGVMTNGGRGFEASEKLAASANISIKHALDILAFVWEDFACGKINESDVWAYFEQRLKRTIDVSRRNIWNTWENEMCLLPEMNDLVDLLKTKGLTVGLLSNVVPPTAKNIQDNGGYDIFDFVVLSCDVGITKPDPLIYNFALSKLPDIAPQEVVFIDDQQRCLEPAIRLGMKTVIAETSHQIRHDLRNFGLVLPK